MRARRTPGATATRPRRSGELEISAGGAAAVRRGHPWVFREQVLSAEALSRFSPGEVATVLDPTGNPCGRAIVDPTSPIALRVWSTDAACAIDALLLRARIARAIAVREALLARDEAAGLGETTAIRWTHGEGDRMPGVVVDRYAHVAVVRLDGEAIGQWEERIAEALFEIAQPKGVRTIALRATTRGEGPKLRTVRGEPFPASIEVSEHGVPFVVDLAHGQKTGAFLDQRENRRRVRALACGRRVLNLFSYAGGFSLNAAIGGATEVTSVDVAAGAHRTAQASFARAGVSLDDHRFVTGDVWRFLEQAHARGERWDLVVSDPPNMAPSAATRARAIVAYRKLHAACAAVLTDDGMLCAASCSSHVTLDDFLGSLTDDVLGRGDLRVVEVAGAGSDHPVLPAFAEGRYLKFCVLA